MAALLLWSLPGRAQAPDGWTISLLWSPEYCNANLGLKEPQCLQERYFELGGLQPRFSAGAGPDCESGALSPESLDRIFGTVANKTLARKIWRTQGACSGLGQPEYMIAVDRAGRRLTVPEEYAAVRKKPLSVTREAFLGAFRRENPELQPEQMLLVCKGKWLREVLVCVDADFRFQRCALDLEGQCPDSFQLRHVRANREGYLPQE
ncbi:hypothetical protein D0B54_19320 [Solimonas sp. K1W22B-7]|nr:hypothetical protein D0B54_19320 [Solimonas sp. K1W22B-7]